MQTFENTLESHPWFADKFNIQEQEQEQEHIVYMRFTRLGIFYKNTHYFFTGTKTDLNNFMLERKKEIDEAKKEVGFGRGDHDNLWDTPLGGFRPPTTNWGSCPPTDEQGVSPPHDEQGVSPPHDEQGVSPPHDDIGEAGFERAPPFGFKDGFERAEPFGFERAEPFAEPLPLSNWKLYLYSDEEELKAAIDELKMATQEQCNGFPNEIIYINQANK